MSLPDCGDLCRLPLGFAGDWLRALAVDRAALAELTSGPADLRAPATPSREATLRDDPLAVAVRLFFCGSTEPDPGVLGHAELATAVACGLLVETAGGIRAPFHLGLAGGLYLFSDYLTGDPDAVMGAGETTAILYRAARPRHRIRRVLDLGCGAGTLALLLAADAQEAIGADINPRAVQLAHFNARANGITNAEFRRGDTFAPVAGEQFDLVVSQPPYYPDSYQGGGQTFLHGGPRGDEIACRVMDGLPAHLTPRGRGLVFTSWPADHEHAPAPGIRILEFHTGRREVHGTRQSLNLVEHTRAGAWVDRCAVPADHWDAVSAARLDALVAAFDLLHADPAALLAARLRWTPGVAVFREGGDLYLRGEPASLTGWWRITAGELAALRQLDQAASVAESEVSESFARMALERGWVCVAYPST